MGLKNRYFPKTPPAFQFIYNSSALFTKTTPSWPQYFIEMQFQKNGPWVEYDYSEDFKMQPFGYRTRLNRVFEVFSQGVASRMAREELARWIFSRYAQKNAGKPLPVAIRFLDARTPVKSKGFLGHWTNKPKSEFSEKNIYLISSHNFGL
jgi:hypothetical protein